MRREWKNRSCCSARLSIFKRLKISIFRHQPRKRWGEATRRDGRSKQGRDVPGGSGAAAPGMLLGTGTARDSEPGMRPQGDEGLHKAAGLRARGMLGPKRGCSVLRWNAQPQGKEVPIQGDAWPQGGMLSSWGGCLALRQDGLSSPASQPWCPCGMGCLPTACGSHCRSGTWYPLWEVGCRKAISKIPKGLFHTWCCSSLLLCAQPEVVVMLPGLALAMPSCSSLGST